MRAPQQRRERQGRAEAHTAVVQRQPVAGTCHPPLPLTLLTRPLPSTLQHEPKIMLTNSPA
eukprot:4833764-Pyramimonas_sp.AAC.2